MTTTKLTDEEKRRIADEYIAEIEKLKKYRYISPVLLLVTLFMFTKRKGLMSYLSIAGIFAAGFFMIFVLLQRQLLSVCPFCGKSLGYTALEFDNIPKSCPKCGEKLRY